jgi:hypothetical protein
MLIDTKLHGGALDGSDIFRDTMPILYEEYLITPFILTPMSEQQLKRVIKEKLTHKTQLLCAGEIPEKLEHDLFILNSTFESLFTMLHKEVSYYTNNINEYVYFYSFLYPHYIEPVKHLTGDELKDKLMRPLSSKSFLGFMKEVSDQGLFMHLSDKEDISTDIQMKEDEQF